MRNGFGNSSQGRHVHIDREGRRAPSDQEDVIKIRAEIFPF